MRHLMTSAHEEIFCISAAASGSDRQAGIKLLLGEGPGAGRGGPG